MIMAIGIAVIILALIAAARALRRENVIERDRVDWPAIGVRAFSWIAGVALVVAAVVLFGAGSTAWRLVLGLIAGVALLVAGEIWIAPRYAWTADALGAAGIGILYATLYAVAVRWGVRSLPVVIIGMLLVSVAAMMLAARRSSRLLALAALIGGFATPALLP